ncbi:unnamed protein product, partial [Heterotrigona itama]
QLLITCLPASYLHVCGSRNPNLDKCILNSLNSMNEKLLHGIPEMDILSIEPLKIGDLVLTDLPNFKAVGSDVKLKGISTYHAHYFHIDLEKKIININMTTNELSTNSLFNITTRILVPIEAMGNLSLITKNPTAQIEITYVVINRGGKKLFYFSSLNLKIHIIDFDLDFHGQTLDKTLDEAIKQTIRNNKKELLAASIVNIEKAISKKCLEIMNNIVKHFTYDELLPDRE